MKLSFDWLSEFVDLSDLTPQLVAEKLTMGAFEVEEIRQVGPCVQGPIKVGEILEINPHPNAEKIRLTKIKIELGIEPLEIVCGAENIIVGQRVPVALPGSRVINRHDGSALPIKPTKIRGVQSNGMLCSAPELGITNGDENGILILDQNPELGSDVIALLHLYPDNILHVGTRSNRGDALSVIGIAREVAALTGRALREPQWHLPPTDKTSETIQIQIENPNDCPYFSIRILEGLQIRDSGPKVMRRLESIGVRPVNNVVDITNYVLHEFGQPLHAYDLNKLKSRQVAVRRAKAGEMLSTIDGRQRLLNDEILIIAENSRPLAVAGVMGGIETEISRQTTFVALESASFQPARVRRSGRLLGLSSESSLCFERGVDVASSHLASDRAAQLILESCAGSLGQITFAGNDHVPSVAVPLRLSQLNRLTEIDLTASEAQKLLAGLSFASQAKSGDELSVSIPSFRQRDVKREIDLIEEICRLWGYDRVQSSMPLNTVAAQLPHSTEKLAAEALCACGLSETYISSLTSRDDLSDANQLNQVVKVLNPLSDDHQILRLSLLPGLIKAVAYNWDHGRHDVWLYEIGRTYERIGESGAKETGVQEDLKLAGILCGQQSMSLWQTESPCQTADPDSHIFFLAKGVVENTLRHLSLNCNSVTFLKDETRSFFHPGRSCVISHETADKRQSNLGWLGIIHPEFAYRYNLKAPIALFELSVSALTQARTSRTFVEIYTTPSVVRDLTVDLNQAVTHASVHDLIVKCAGPFLRDVRLVSIFNLPNKDKSLSYRLTFQHGSETLTAEQVDKFMSGIRNGLQKELEASFRY